ncbi:MAG: rhodanese-like domain-containing protein [Parasphingorhabdus sp.]
MINVKIGFKEMIARADAEIDSISPMEILDLRQNDKFLLIDIRDVRELERDGMIPGAFHCPRGMMEFWVHPESPYHKSIFSEDRKFIFYCASGWRSALTAKAAKDIGLSPVAHIKGGFTAWCNTGGPVTEKSRKNR